MPVRRIASSVVIDAELGALLNASVTPLPDDAAKADVAGGGVDGLGVARRRAVAAAVIGSAEMRAALQDLARDADLRLAAVITAVLRRATRVLGRAAGTRRRYLVAHPKPVGSPLPDVAYHVIQPIAVRGIRPYGRCARVAIVTAVFVRELALPGVGHMAPLRRELIAPGVFGAIEPAARGELPLRLARQFLAGPGGVGLGVAVCNVHHRMVLEACERAAGTVGTPPESAESEPPPLTPVVEIDRPPRRGEHQRTSFQHVRQCAGVVLRVWGYLGESDVAGRLDEATKLAVGHRCAVHPEAIHAHAMPGPLLGVVSIRAHQESSARDPDHLRVRGFDALCGGLHSGKRRFGLGLGHGGTGS